MMRVLVTAFGPYDGWTDNASWLAMVRLTQNLPRGLSITTRRYPVDFLAVKKLLAQDLSGRFDVALHLGQAPGSAHVRLERVAINYGGHNGQLPEQHQLLADDGPVAYASALPLDRWARRIRAAGIPAQVSYHAGTFLCNATLYWTHYWSERLGYATRAAFVHLPLDVSQAVAAASEAPSLPADLAALAVRLILEDLSGAAA